MTKRSKTELLAVMALAILMAAFTSVSVAQQVSDLDKGRALMTDGKCPEAIDAFQKYLRTNNTDWHAYHNIGLCYVRLNKFQQAIPFFQKTIEINSNDTAAYDLLAATYNKVNDRKGAISVMEALVTHSPKLDDAYNDLGYLYYENNQFDKAITAYRKAIQLNPTNEDYKKNLDLAERLSEFLTQSDKAHQYFAAEDYKKAIGAYQQAAKLVPGSAATFYNLGGAFYNSEQYSKAVAAYQEALRLDPNFPQAKEDLADAQTADKGKKASRKAFWSGVAGAVSEALADDKASQASGNGNSQQTTETQNGSAETATSAISNAPGGFSAGHVLLGRYKRDGVQQSLTFNSDGTFNRGDAAAGSIRGGEYSAGATSSGNYYLSGHNLSLKYGDGRTENFEIEIFNCCAQPDYGSQSPVQLKLNHVLYTNVD